MNTNVESLKMQSWDWLDTSILFRWLWGSSEERGSSELRGDG